MDMSSRLLGKHLGGGSRAAGQTDVRPHRAPKLSSVFTWQLRRTLSPDARIPMCLRTAAFPPHSPRSRNQTPPPSQPGRRPRHRMDRREGREVHARLKHSAAPDWSWTWLMRKVQVGQSAVQAGKGKLERSGAVMGSISNPISWLLPTGLDRGQTISPKPLPQLRPLPLCAVLPPHVSPSHPGPGCQCEQELWSGGRRETRREGKDRGAMENRKLTGPQRAQDCF